MADYTKVSGNQRLNLTFPKLSALFLLTKPNTLFKGRVFTQEEYLPTYSESLAHLPIRRHT